MLAPSRAVVAVVGLVTFFSVGTAHASQSQETSPSSFSAMDWVSESVNLRSLGTDLQYQPEIVRPENGVQQTITLDFASDNVASAQLPQRVPEPPAIALVGTGLLLFRGLRRPKYQQLRGAAKPV